MGIHHFWREHSLIINPGSTLLGGEGALILNSLLEDLDKLSTSLNGGWQGLPSS